jgi:hypothetical protein
MPSPPRPTLDELNKHLCNNHGCKYEEIRTNFGKQIRTGACFSRQADGVTKKYPFFTDEVATPLAWGTVRAICRKLGLELDLVYPGAPGS